MTLHDYNDLFKYGLLNGELVSIDDVSNGLSCNCKCPNCGTDLVAYNNPKNKRVSHFQHKSIFECNAYFETTLHYLAKKIIGDSKKLAVPDVNFSLSGYARSYSGGISNSNSRLENTTILNFDEVLIEKNSIDVRPDLICIINKKKVLIEIAVTHFIDDDKKKKTYNNKIPTLEIDLSNFNRAIQEDKLREVLHGNIKLMKWIYNPKIHERKTDIEKRAKPIIEFVNKNTHSLKVYGKEKHIYNCPIYKGIYDKIKIEDECEKNCRYYSDTFEGIVGFAEEPLKYPEISITCIGHVASEFDDLLKIKGVKWKDKW